MSTKDGISKQTARMYYKEKDHKDAYFEGKLHSAMYMVNEEYGCDGIIWRKMPTDKYFVCSTRRFLGAGRGYDESPTIIYPNNECVERNCFDHFILKASKDCLFAYWQFFYGGSMPCYYVYISLDGKEYIAYEPKNLQGQYINDVYSSKNGFFYSTYDLTSQQIYFSYCAVNSKGKVTNDISLFSMDNATLGKVYSCSESEFIVGLKVTTNSEQKPASTTVQITKIYPDGTIDRSSFIMSGSCYDYQLNCVNGNWVFLYHRYVYSTSPETYASYFEISDLSHSTLSIIRTVIHNWTTPRYLFGIRYASGTYYLYLTQDRDYPLSKYDVVLTSSSPFTGYSTLKQLNYVTCRSLFMHPNKRGLGCGEPIIDTYDSYTIYFRGEEKPTIEGSYISEGNKPPSVMFRDIEPYFVFDNGKRVNDSGMLLETQIISIYNYYVYLYIDNPTCENSNDNFAIPIDKLDYYTNHKFGDILLQYYNKEN